jgi:aspartyl-tRNA(Asn)/glutamyl-tRNA(Gln) amidotransferase subunit C
MDKDQIQKIASLAHLNFNDSELEQFTEQFNKILGYISSIDKLDIADLEPLTRPSEEQNNFREDITKPSISKEETLKNAPQKNEVFFKVPKVLE